jgi:murein DD-endopeptidase MepM/ murein hydrolase activator NlpD
MGARLGGVIRATRAYYAVVPLAIPLVLLSVVRQPPASQTPAASVAEKPPIDYVALASEPPAPLPEHASFVTIESGDTLDALFEACGLTRDEANTLVAAFAPRVDPRSLRPGQMIRYRRNASGVTTEVEFLLSGWGSVRARRDGAGFAVEELKAPESRMEATLAAEIDSSLWSALVSTGENPSIVTELVDVFQWDIDFFHLQRGDRFSFVVEKKYVGADFVGYGPILAARFEHKGTPYEAYRLEREDGTAGYYAANGAPLRKQFLKSPLKYSRVTSKFTSRRFHPVLKSFRPHYGVDYGAPTGTPVMCTADGVVSQVGRGGGEGNIIRVRHSSRTETAYLHLSRFAKGIRKGSRVSQGDVIGYVGATGLATAPHLDYRVRESGKWIDPLKLRSVTPDPLHGRQLARFKGIVAEHASKLSSQEQWAAGK